MNQLDLVIANGTVIEGTVDAVPVVADVGVAGGKIVGVGDLSTRTRRHTLDAGGKVVAPGFIDTHTHVEMSSVTASPDRFAPVAQGVTTTLVGADGFGWVGLDPGYRERWWEDSAGIYGNPPSPPPAWTTPEEFIADLRAASPTDVVPMIPHGNVRAVVMGDEARPAGASERRCMRELVDLWMDAGAVGLASGLDYLPGRYAETDEIVDLCDRVVERGGVYASHLRNQDAGRAGAWEEIGEIGRRTGIPIRIAHERLDEEGAELLSQVLPGNEVTLDSYLYPAGCTSLVYHVPAGLLRDGVMALSRRLRSDSELATDLAESLTESLQGGSGRQAIIAATTTGRYEGSTLEELAAERGATVGEVAVDLMRTELPSALLVYLWQTADRSWDETVARTLASEHSMIASDGVYVGSRPHPRGFGAFPRVLGELVRGGLISLEAAIHKMTGKPALAYGLGDRGRLVPGLRADVVVFDPTVISGPADFARPRVDPIGIELVLIGGRKASEETFR